MGLLATKLCGGEDKPSKVLILGLDGAGKTTILYRLVGNGFVTTAPTVGFNVESVALSKGLTVSVWDVGGQSQLRALWRHYYTELEGLIYVVDSSDRERLSEARDELFRVLECPDMPVGCPVLVIANKSDKSDALTQPEIIDAMSLSTIRNRKWQIESASSKTGDGFNTAVTVFSMLVTEYKRQKKKIVRL